MRLRDRLMKIASEGESGLHWVSRVLVYAAAAGLFVMMALVVIDVVGRYFFNHPLKGDYELIGFTLVLAGPLAMAYCQVQKGHIRVDFLLGRFPKKVQAILTVLANLFGFVIFSLMFWQVILLVSYYMNLEAGNTTYTLHIPISPFVVVLAVGMGVLAVVLLFDLVHSIVEVKRK
jgi:TRAP-type C4-dicarboxylate transport system permease small subunit